MKLLGIYSICGESALLLQKLREEGMDVAMYISDESSRKIADGLVWKADSPSELNGADVIIFDDNGKGNVADTLRERGKLVWCGGAIADRLEKDRAFGMKTFSDCGIPIPDTYEVSGLGDVKTVCSSEFQRGDKVVVKLDDSAGCSTSYVAKNPQDLIDTVTHWEEDGQIKVPWTGIVQRFVEGIEVSIEGWWNGQMWSNQNLTIEEKKCWPGDLGPAVGCSYNTIAKIRPNSKLFRMMVAPVAEVLKGTGYTGQIDTNIIVGEDGPVALEFTPRPGYDATPTMIWGDSMGYAGRVAEALGIEIESQKEDRPGPFWAGVRVSVPPYPFESKSDRLSQEVYETACGVPLPDASPDFYLYDVCSGERGLVCAGTIGVIGVAMGGGASPREAGKAAYRVAEKLQIPNKAFRALDGWKRAEEQIPELISGGWINLA